MLLKTDRYKIFLGDVTYFFNLSVHGNVPGNEEVIKNL